MPVLHHSCWLRLLWKVDHPQRHFGTVFGSRFRITARIVRIPGLRSTGYPIPRQVSYMFTGSYMIEPFIQQGRPDLA
jgi:hypothetical protein